MAWTTVLELILFGGNSSASGGGIVPTGDGTMNFSRLPANPAQSDALLALLEDI